MRTTFTTTFTTTLAALALAACGGGDPATDTGAGTGSTPPATTTAPATTAPPTTAAATPPVALTGTVNDRGTAPLTGATLTMELADFSFAPTYVTAKGGAVVTLALTNSGKATHTFTALDPAIDVTVEAGGTGVAAVTLPKSGTVAFYCRFHRGQGMQGGFAVR